MMITVPTTIVTRLRIEIHVGPSSHCEAPGARPRHLKPGLAHRAVPMMLREVTLVEPTERDSCFTMQRLVKLELPAIGGVGL